MKRLAILSMLLLGCESSTTPGAGVNVVGTWSLTATQISPPLEITGEVLIEHQDGSSVTGEVATLEEAADGTVSPHSGSLAGRVLGDVVDFDVFIDLEPRRHVGLVRGDSITGSWAQSTGGVPLTGAFILQKVTP
jgi:hypothetical protein